MMFTRAPLRDAILGFESEEAGTGEEANGVTPSPNNFSNKANLLKKEVQQSLVSTEACCIQKKLPLVSP